MNWCAGRGVSSLGTLFNSLINNSQRICVREASKKSSGGGNKNPKQAPGNRKGIWKGDGCRVHQYDILVHKQTKLWFHPGVNVRLAGKLHLVARRTGTVRVTCEKPDLNFQNYSVKKYYAEREGQVFYKKYFHVIPDPQHTRFKCIDTI